MDRDRAKKKVETSSASSIAADTDDALARLMVIEYAKENEVFLSMNKEDCAVFLELKRMNMKMQQKKIDIKERMLANQEYE